MSARAHALRITVGTAAAALGFGLALPLSGAASAAPSSDRCEIVSWNSSSLCSARALVKNVDGSISVDPLTDVPAVAQPAPVAPAPAAPAPLLSEAFGGADGVFASDSAFWSSADRGAAQNPGWLAESGTLNRQAESGRTTSPVFRMWTRRTDLAHVTAEMDVRFNGWVGGSDGWHGINLWLNSTLCTPFPGCSAVNDGGNSGYALDFMNRDGSLTVLKKVPGDTRGQWSNGAIDYSYGGTYYWMTSTTWRPVQGQTYRLAGKAIDNGDGTTTLQVLIDGRVMLEVLDDGRMGGPRLTGGRVGVRSDYADVSVDNLAVSR